MGFSIFKAARGSGISDKDAKVIGPVLESIVEEEGGSYSVDDVIDRLEAGSPTVEPLRPYYLWDPKDQQRAYLRTRTQELQRWIVIEVENPNDPDAEPIEVPGFRMTSDSPRRHEGQATYTSTAGMLGSMALNNREAFIEQQIGRIRKQLERWDRQLSAWKELSGIRKKLRALHQELEAPVLV